MFNYAISLHLSQIAWFLQEEGGHSPEAGPSVGVAFPLASVKTLVRAVLDLQTCPDTSAFVAGRAAELLVEKLTCAAFARAKSARRVAISYDDIASALSDVAPDGPGSSLGSKYLHYALSSVVPSRVSAGALRRSLKWPASGRSDQQAGEGQAESPERKRSRQDIEEGPPGGNGCLPRKSQRDERGDDINSEGDREKGTEKEEGARGPGERTEEGGGEGALGAGWEKDTTGEEAEDGPGREAERTE